MPKGVTLRLKVQIHTYVQPLPAVHSLFAAPWMFLVLGHSSPESRFNIAPCYFTLQALLFHLLHAAVMRLCERNASYVVILVLETTTELDV